MGAGLSSSPKIEFSEQDMLLWKEFEDADDFARGMLDEAQFEMLLARRAYKWRAQSTLLHAHGTEMRRGSATSFIRSTSAISGTGSVDALSPEPDNCMRSMPSGTASPETAPNGSLSPIPHDRGRNNSSFSGISRLESDGGLSRLSSEPEPLLLGIVRRTSSSVALGPSHTAFSSLTNRRDRQLARIAAQFVIENFDLDHDGLLSFEEFRQWHYFGGILKFEPSTWITAGMEEEFGKLKAANAPAGVATIGAGSGNWKLSTPKAAGGSSRRLSTQSVTSMESDEALRMKLEGVNQTPSPETNRERYWKAMSTTLGEEDDVKGGVNKQMSRRYFSSKPAQISVSSRENSPRSSRARSPPPRVRSEAPEGPSRSPEISPMAASNRKHSTRFLPGAKFQRAANSDTVSEESSPSERSASRRFLVRPKRWGSSPAVSPTESKRQPSFRWSISPGKLMRSDSKVSERTTSSVNSDQISGRPNRSFVKELYARLRPFSRSPE